MWMGSARLMRGKWPPVSLCTTCHVTKVSESKWMIIIIFAGVFAEVFAGVFGWIIVGQTCNQWKQNHYRRSDLWVSALHTQRLHQADREERGEGKLTIQLVVKLHWDQKSKRRWLPGSIISLVASQPLGKMLWMMNRKFDGIKRQHIQDGTLQWYIEIRWLVLLLLWWAEARLLEHQLQVISPVLTLLFWFLLFQIYSMWYF